MKLKLTHLSTDFLTVGKPTDMDLFNAQGHLLLAKGQLVTPPIMELLLTRNLYILQYEWKQEQSSKQSFSSELYQKILGSMQRIYCDAHLVSSESLSGKRRTGCYSVFRVKTRFSDYGHHNASIRWGKCSQANS